MYKTNQTVAEIVANDYRTAGVFKKYGLDFCCGGHKPVADVCQKKDLDAESLIAELNELSERSVPGEQINFRSWTPELLITYIEQMHHRYVRDAIPRIAAYTQKVAMRHGETLPVLIEIHNKFMELAAEMQEHMEDEEKRVFPLIIELMSQKGSPHPRLPEMIKELEDEHSAAGSLIAELRTLTDGFKAPEWACSTFRISFQELEGFESDLHHHVHLENNILFPKVAKMLRYPSLN